MNDQFRAGSRSHLGYAHQGASALRGYGALLPFALLVGSLAHAPETRFSMASLLTGSLPHETGSLDATSYNTSISCRRSAPCSVSHLIRACADAI